MNKYACLVKSVYNKNQRIQPAKPDCEKCSNQVHQKIELADFLTVENFSVKRLDLKLQSLKY